MQDSIFFNEDAWAEHWSSKGKEKATLCTRCVYDNTTPGIVFDQNGVCNFCHTHDDLCAQYPDGDAGWQILEKQAETIKKAGKNKKFDVVVGVSGGADSSFLVETAITLGLRPLAVHFDNTWNSTIAVENIHNVLKKLNVELWTYVVDNEEYDDLYRSFLKAGVPDLEAPTDIGLARVLNMAAEKHGLRYIFEGHSFRTEGISPLGWLYMDAKYIQTVQKIYGSKRLKTFPNLWMHSMLKTMILYRIKKIRPFWFMNHNKKSTMAGMKEKYGWQWYGGHHLENRITAFYHTYFLPRRFGIDQRSNGFAAMIRSGQMERNEAIAQLKAPPSCDLEIVELVKSRLGITDEEFKKLMTAPVKTYKDFKTYKPTFERMRPFFYLMAKMDLIPMSFYMKYTKK